MIVFLIILKVNLKTNKNIILLGIVSVKLDKTVKKSSLNKLIHFKME